MKLSIIVPAFPTVSETFIYHQIAELIRRGHDVEILAYRSGDSQVKHAMIDRMNMPAICRYYPRDARANLLGRIRKRIKQLLHLSGFPGPAMLHEMEWKRMISYYDRISAAPWFETGSGGDIIHAHFGLTALPLLPLRRQGKLRDTRIVVSFHGRDLEPAKLGILGPKYRDLFREASALIANTPYLEELLLSAGAPVEKVHVIPIGLDLEDFQVEAPEPRALDEPFRVLFIGRLILWKGPHLALEILHELLRRAPAGAFCLDIAGDGPLRRELEQKAQSMGLSDHVCFHGACSQETIKILLRQAHCLLLPGIYDPKTGRAETQGLVIQEAQAMQTPPLTSDAGGARYGISDGRTGYILPAGNVNAFADRILYLAGDEAARLLMAKAGRAWVEQHYDIKNMISRIEHIYEYGPA